MSTLKLTTISNVAGTSSVSADTVINGTCKAWVNFNGTTGAIRSSFNVSSVTRVSSGNYNVTMTNATPDTNYVITASQSGSGTTVGSAVAANWRQSAGANQIPTTTVFALSTFDYTYGSVISSDYVMAAVFR